MNTLCTPDNRKKSVQWLVFGLVTGILGLASMPALAITTYNITRIGLYYGDQGGSTTRFLNAAGHVAGQAYGYNGTTSLGQLAWIYNGSSTQQIGLTDATHTRNDGYQHNNIQFLNNVGQVLGSADRFGSLVGSTYGYSVWLFNGSSTQQIGLTDALHTTTNGVQHNWAVGLNAAGQAAGNASLYNGTTNSNSAWFYNGTSTQEIGLLDAAHTNYNGAQGHYAQMLNDAGQVVGNSGRYSGGAVRGSNAWIYNGNTNAIQQIGLIDAAHTSIYGDQYSVGQYFNAAGYVAGNSTQYSPTINSGGIGHSTWLYNGTSTIEIGLTDAAHTNSYGGQDNQVLFLNANGQAVGSSRSAGGQRYGESAWIYNGSSTQEIGLTNAAHTGSDGVHRNKALFLNDAGQVAGSSEYVSGSSGSSAWFYSGNSTQEIGLTDAAHTYITGEQRNEIKSLNAAGQVAGNSTRYGAPGGGTSAWLYGNGSTQEIGLTDVLHTSSTGKIANTVSFLNAAGLVAGSAERYNGSTNNGVSAWLFDSATNQTYTLDISVSPTMGQASSYINYLGDDGLALGSYYLYDTDGTSLGARLFAFTIADGAQDIGTLVDGGLDAAGWRTLGSTYNLSHANGTSYIAGTGIMVGVNNVEGAYLLSPTAVPEPETYALMLAGLGLIGWRARRRG